MKSMIKKILPKQWLEYIRIKILSSYATKSYSQEGEDMILRRIFEHKADGFYVDVGAHHPVRFSNTYLFYKQGWTGINIDAMPGAMKLFNKIRPKDINLEQAISEKEKTLTYYQFNDPALNGFDVELSENRDSEPNGYNIQFKTQLKTKSLEIILDDYLPINKIIDFMSIDVEGLDYEVLRSLNLIKYKPRVLLLEILYTSDNNNKNEIVSYLEQNGYIYFAKALNTTFFRHKDFLR